MYNNFFSPGAGSEIDIFIYLFDYLFKNNDALILNHSKLIIILTTNVYAY